MSAKSWWSALVLTGAAAVLGSVIGGNTTAVAASDNDPRTYAGDYQGGSLPIGLVDDDDVDVAGTDIVQKLLQVRTVG